MLILLFKSLLICPLALLAVCVAALNFLLGLYLQLLVSVYTDTPTKRLLRKLLFATTINEYAAVALELDRRVGTDCWKRDLKSPAYDYHRVQLWQRSLSMCIESRAEDRICEVLTQAQKLYHGGAFSPDVYSFAYWNTKESVTNYHKLLIAALDLVTESILSAEAPLLKQLNFVNQFSKLWGKAALILEGKRHAAYAHFGVCKGLLQLRCVPLHVYAKEANALLGAWLVLSADNTSIDDVNQQKVEADVVLAIELLRSPCKWYSLNLKRRKRILAQLATIFGDITLQEAHNLSGRHLNLICKRNNQYFLMNHKTTPDVSVASAVLACACEDVLQPTGGGMSCPLSLTTGDRVAWPPSLWGIVVREEGWRSLIFPSPLQVGRPNHGLSGTVARDLIGAVYAIRTLFRDTFRQLSSIIFVSHQLSRPSLSSSESSTPSSSSRLSSAVRCSGLTALAYSWLDFRGRQEEVSDLLTPPKTRVRINPSVSRLEAREKQIAQGLTAVFHNACLLKARLEVEKCISDLVDAACQAGEGSQL